MRRKRNNKLVGIYLWKLILIIITIFVVFISIECFFLVEKTVRKFVSGFSEEYNSSTTDLNENIITNEEGENTDITNDGTNSKNLESIQNDVIISNDTEPATDGETTVAVGDTLYCTENHTHKDVCYDATITPEDRMTIYNLINDISSLTAYTTVLNSLKSYTTNYNNSSSDSYYNNYKSYLDSNCPKIEAADNTMNSVPSQYQHYIENKDKLVELRSVLKFREIFNLLNTIPRRSEVNNKITELKNTQNVTESITYLTQISNTVTPVYQSFVTNIVPNVDNSWYQYIINYNNMLELQHMSENLSKIIDSTKFFSNLEKWDDVIKKINTYKTSQNVSEYLTYLTEVTTKVNEANNNFTNINLSSDYYKYVINYENYNKLLAIPKILKCAQIINVLPEYEDITQNINDFESNNQVDECINYLSEISSQINDAYSKFTAEKLNSNYNTYVINYEKLTKLYDMHFNEILYFTKQIKTLPKSENVTNKITECKETNDVTGCIEYLKEVISSNYETIYSNLINSKNLKQSHYAYIINYDNIKKLYDLQLTRILNLIKEIEDLPLPSEVNFSDSKTRSMVIATSQRYKKLVMENKLLSEYVINYEKLSELEKQLTNADKEINITVQYYAYINIIDNISVPTAYDSRLNFIDTSGKSMPINRGYAKSENTSQLDISPTENAIKHVYVDKDGNVIYEKQLRSVYRDHTYNFSRYFEDFYVDNMLNFTTFYDLLDTNYELIEIWLLQDDKDATSINKDDFNIYQYTKDIYFTRNMNDMNENAIRLTKDATVRYVYNTKAIENGVDIPVTFYDYDITSGVIFKTESDAKNNINPQLTSTQDKLGTAFVRTSAYGINSNENYHGTGTRLGFGGINTGVTHNTDRWMNNGVSNALSGPNRTGGWGTPSNSYQNCVFNIVKGIENGKIIYSDGIVAPNLFNDGDAIGKKTYTDYSLKFNRTGDRYLLTEVNGTNTKNLEKLVHPHEDYPNISTNNFWPMDDALSFGNDGYDLKFGLESKKTNRRFVGSSNGEFPISDNKNKDHNSYFGMRGEIEFDLSSEYVGPLEWHFYGDDDLWIFLDDQLIIDIGGVHSSVGEYANFWDYLTPGDSGHHKITFFFTERGASGSTCWMRFALPEIVKKETDYTKGNLKLEKTVVGSDTTENFNFVVTLKDKDSQELNEYFYYAKYNLEGTKLREEIFRSGGTISFNKDEYIIIEGLPANTTYSIEEVANLDFIAQSENSTGNIIAGETVTSKFINTYGTKSITVIKQWDDNNNTENRPEEVNVKLIPKFQGEEIVDSTTDIGEVTSENEQQVVGITGEEYFNQYYPSIELVIPLDANNNWTYEWSELPKYRPIYDATGENIIEMQEIEYSVEEIYTNELSEKYYPLPVYQNENGNFILTNVLYKKLEITKRDADDINIKLGGAEFKLEKLKEVDGKFEIDENEEPVYGATSFEVDNLGKLTFNKLKYGIYRLTEEKAPDGYNLNKRVIEIEITPETEMVTREEFINKKGSVLPFTGGTGIKLFTLSGLLLIIFTLANINKHKVKVQKTRIKKRRRKPTK